MIKNILTNKCPRCGKGRIFKNPNIYFNFGKPEMNESCPKCGFKNHKEPGFFYGAMYVSYGLTVGQGIMTFLVASPFFAERFDLRIIGVIALVLILLSSFNMRISRILWLYLFKSYKR
ncbi:DUF983 domain-containing protein [Allomuricauda sp. SCSIO 65647]|uniref:DUF983 domain-containing protein n=1 Tax=Allomuricauda sp. SCSIO 65647 TaxID=2908843 RepID=UPI001F237171|nr:DUF983 domain-containing protein [Muricauda sp. SCSIO 65647]UJH66387.1 DUF983 domain-containing protein [Muricauda sp. SCSIO 65647]